MQQYLVVVRTVTGEQHRNLRNNMKRLNEKLMEVRGRFFNCV